MSLSKLFSNILLFLFCWRKREREKEREITIFQCNIELERLKVKIVIAVKGYRENSLELGGGLSTGVITIVFLAEQ